MKIKPVIFLITVGVCVAVSFFAYRVIQRNSLTPVTDKNILIVGVCDDYAPYTYSKDGSVIGFDVDLVHELARRMKKKIEIRVMAFEMLLLELQRGAIDLIASGINITPEREKRVNFSIPYSQADDLISITLKPIKYENLEALQDKRVGVNEGYVADGYISAQKNIEVHRLENVAKAIIALKTGKIDAFVTEDVSFKPYTDQHGDTLFNTAIIKQGAEEPGCGIAITKNNQELLEKINATLIELQEDGTLEDLKKRWSIGEL